MRRRTRVLPMYSSKKRVQNDDINNNYESHSLELLIDNSLRLDSIDLIEFVVIPVTIIVMFCICIFLPIIICFQFPLVPMFPEFSEMLVIPQFPFFKNSLMLQLLQLFLVLNFSSILVILIILFLLLFRIKTPNELYALLYDILQYYVQQQSPRRTIIRTNQL
jgi:hypothetical protein